MEISKAQINEILKYLQDYDNLLSNRMLRVLESDINLKNIIRQFEQILDSEH